jgi:hypothetical protein
MLTKSLVIMDLFQMFYYFQQRMFRICISYTGKFLSSPSVLFYIVSPSY